MDLNKIDSKNFNESFSKLLETKKGQDVVKGRFDIEPFEINDKINFIIYLISSFEPVLGVTYKILFWEKDSVVQSFLELFKEKKNEISTTYKNGETPGEVFIDDAKLDTSFLTTLLTNHFNYEMAKTPSLNIRVQLCVNRENYITLIDIYDDRGFDIYYVPSIVLLRNNR